MAPRPGSAAGRRATCAVPDHDHREGSSPRSTDADGRPSSSATSASNRPGPAKPRWRSRSPTPGSATGSGERCSPRRSSGPARTGSSRLVASVRWGNSAILGLIGSMGRAGHVRGLRWRRHGRDDRPAEADAGPGRGLRPAGISLGASSGRDQLEDLAGRADRAEVGPGQDVQLALPVLAEAGHEPVQRAAASGEPAPRPGPVTAPGRRRAATRAAATGRSSGRPRSRRRRSGCARAGIGRALVDVAADDRHADRAVGVLERRGR